MSRPSRPAGKKIDPRELYWAAGFLEGDGCFALATNKYKQGRRSYQTPIVNASQKQKWPLVVLQLLFGGGLHEYTPGRANLGYGPYWQWSVGGARAAGLMMTVYKFMSPERKDKIKSALAHWRNS